MSNYDPNQESQIINELAQIKKEVVSIKRQISGSVATGMIGASIIIGIALSIIQVMLRR